MTNRNKTTAIPIPISDPPSHIPTVLPTSSRPKQRLEPTRTTKKSQKLVVFPDAEVEEEQVDENCIQIVSDEEFPFTSNAPQSFRLKDLRDHCLKMNLTGSVDIKRFDEVLYSPYFIDKEKSELAGKLEDAVASDAPIGEIFVFDYGVVVIWGLDEEDEKKALHRLQPYETDRLSPDDVELESFSFCHNPDKPARLFNDIINLRTGHHLVKLTISHALAQSVKLAYFEELIENTILHTKNIPYELSSTGTIKMSRQDINRQIGELFAMRMNVNLISNVLDTPELFWSFPTLAPLYRAVRGYLEISQRVEVLNQRCAVLSDMLDMLRDHANIMHGETLEWIVIVLIAIEIFIGIAKGLGDVLYSR
ncbi:hypothetical protein PSACC_02843 [Paramicrosporidium saccamoebae]|uniref:DUF155 domain-containing protein n=1 Tax=Paramicrosporidium saccamoebae TaxID=1246581 RepID=A0A2H9THV5_9FUNG|nr:hypothetical protein PSACC_02843 [Paramicrosporidium saccamoebae]